ncbi:MAG: hypothetical protein ACYTEQ_22745 [Planctomycetota bacterium]|jgi:hypothetical protein
MTYTPYERTVDCDDFCIIYANFYTFVKMPHGATLTLRGHVYPTDEQLADLRARDALKREAQARARQQVAEYLANLGG